MDQSGSRTVRHVRAQHLRVMEPKRIERSVGIMLISGIQLIKAAVLLLTVALLQTEPELVSGPSSPLYPLLYVATRGRIDSMNGAMQGGAAVSGLMILLGLYLGAIGIGMFYVNVWARRTLIFSSGLTLAFYAKSTLWPDPEAMASPNMTNVYVLLAVDLFVFLYLLRSNTAELFKNKR